MPIFPTIKLTIERWKYNPTFELYVSNMGHIKNKSKASLAPKITQGGYVVVYVGGSNPHWMLLHRVVMLTWRPTPEAETLTVDHLDHNKRNNALSNLEWVTKEENLRRADEDLLRDSKKMTNNSSISELRQKHVTKKSQSASNITGVRVESKNIALGNFIIRRSSTEDINTFVNMFLGKVNNFTAKGVSGILKDIYSGKNPQGYKKWCGFEFFAVREEQ